MSWPWRALLGPFLWAFAFAGVYAVQGLGCAQGWPADLHRVVLVVMWLLALAGAGLILWLSPKGSDIGDRIALAGGWLGLVAIALTLFPVLGMPVCGAAP